MALARWILAALLLGSWAAVAWANARIALGPPPAEGRKPSLVMLLGGLLAAGGLRALPLPGASLPGGPWGSWLVLALLDAGTLGWLPLGVFSLLGGPPSHDKEAP